MKIDRVYFGGCMMKPAQQCPSCNTTLQLERLRCPTCQTVVEGQFRWPRLARLSPEDQELIEMLILASGSLKAVAEKLKISYPTIRKRLDALIEHLAATAKADEAFHRQLLRDVAAGKRTPQEATRLLEQDKGGSHG